MSGFSQIRLYSNTTNSIPVGEFTDVTEQILGSATASVTPNVIYDYDNGEVTVTGLQPGTQYWLWIELIDTAGNTSGIISLGSHNTNPVVAIDGALATVTSSNPVFSPDFSASYIFDGQYGWIGDVFASPANTPPVTINFTLSSPKRIVGFRLYSAAKVVDGLPHSFPGLISFSRDGTVLASKSLQASDYRAGTTNPGAASLRNDYVDLYFTNPQEATNYSIFCMPLSANSSAIISIVELVMYEPIKVLPIPALTSFTDKGYTVTESSNAAANYFGWRAFDRISGASFEAWVANPNESPPHFLAVQLPGGATVTGVRLWNTEAWDHVLVRFCTIQGSDDGTNWSDLAVFSNMTYTVIPSADKATNVFFQEDFDTDDIPTDNAYLFQGTVTNSVSYTHYRLLMDVNEGPPPRFSEVVFLA